MFPAPTAIEAEILRSHRVVVVGRTSAVRERYYAISVERRLKHAAVAAITSAARTEIFAELGSPRSAQPRDHGDGLRPPRDLDQFLDRGDHQFRLVELHPVGASVSQ